MTTNLTSIMRAYHFLKADMTSSRGGEPPWTIGEMRWVTGVVILCEYGYHWSSSWYGGVSNAPGPIACIVEVANAEPIGDLGVSPWRRLVVARDVSRELRLYACECTERALGRERDSGREPDQCLWETIAVAQRFASGEATIDELEAAREVARGAAWEVARGAAWSAAWEAAWSATRELAWEAARGAARSAARGAARSATRSAAWEAAMKAEVAWQRQRLAELLNPLFAEVEA